MRLAVALLSYRIGEQTRSSSFIGPRWRGAMTDGSELRRRGLRRRGGSTSKRTAPLDLPAAEAAAKATTPSPAPAPPTMHAVLGTLPLACHFTSWQLSRMLPAKFCEPRVCRITCGDGPSR